jgi:hypothetical protein
MSARRDRIVNPATEGLPGFWRFAWLFLMQPVTLSRLLRSVGISPKESLWRLLRRRRSPVDNWWLLRLAQVLLMSLPSAAALRLMWESPMNWSHLPLSISEGVIVGSVMALADVSFGAYVGIAMVSISALPTSAGSFRVWALPFAFVLGFATTANILVSGGATSYSFASLLHIPLFPLEVTLETLARLWNTTTHRGSLAWTPVLYHELSQLPLPFLENHIVAEADVNPALARRVLDACSIAPGQRRIGRRAEAKLRARELARLAQAKDFQSIAELRGLWLPGIQGADPLLLSFSETGRYLAAANAAFSPHHRLKHLEGLAAQLNAIENQLRAKRSAFTQPFEEPLLELRDAGHALRIEAEKNAAGRILNPFRVFESLSPEAGPELFRGREHAVHEIEDALADAGNAVSLQLLAPRRAGKTSLLKMLPGMLPDTVCVFFDVQAHPVASVSAFWNKLAEQALNQAKLHRRTDLPPLPSGPPMEAAAAWLGKVDQLPDGRRVLIAIDEFERLEDLFPGSRQEFLQLMGLFRATIQHRKRIRLLVSGSAPFDELDRVWDDHFISARQIKLPFLDEPTSIGLLTQPDPGFPADAIPAQVAQEVYQRTGGQPFLLQVFGSLLVNRLNDTSRRTAVIADIAAVEGQAIEWAEPYFRDMYRSAPAAARQALDHLSQGPADLSPAARRWLTQRYLLTPGDRLAVPLFGAWISHHAISYAVGQ